MARADGTGESGHGSCVTSFARAPYSRLVRLDVVPPAGANTGIGESNTAARVIAAQVRAGDGVWRTTIPGGVWHLYSFSGVTSSTSFVLWR